MFLINSLKAKIKKYKVLLRLYEAVFQKDLINVLNSRHGKRVLFSYSTYHFKNKNYVKHSNYSESLIVAEVFDELGYQVDVVNNNKLTKLDLSQYDMIFGEGLPMFQALELEIKALKIYYGTGSHPFQCTQQSIQRLMSYHKSSGYLAFESLRASDYRWGIAASLCDAVICIGNDTTTKTFLDYNASRVLKIDPSFHSRADAITIGLEKDFDKCRKSVVWFGSYGLLHKGLDLAVEAIRSRPDWTLHICGYTDVEFKLLESLNLPSNTVVHGFVNLFSNDFKKICEDCGFVLLPSCSEGIATAVISCVANGAMIPIVTKESGFDTGKNGYLVEINSESIVSVLDLIDESESDRLREMALSTQEDTLSRYTLANYKQRLITCIKEVIDEHSTVS